MYKNQRRIKELTPYIPAVDIFRIYEREPGVAFLDSSLVNELGHYSVIGRMSVSEAGKGRRELYYQRKAGNSNNL